MTRPWPLVAIGFALGLTAAWPPSDRLIGEASAAPPPATAPDEPVPAAARRKPPGADSPARRHLTVGKAAPPFKIRDLQGAMVRLDELAYPGREKSYAPKRPVLIDFFRTDCAPCIAALPELIQLHETHGRSGLHIMLVALLEEERGEEKLEAFLAARKLPFAVVKDPTDHVAEKYMGTILTLPATFLIDRRGVLRQKHFGGDGGLAAALETNLLAVLSEHREAAR